MEYSDEYLLQFRSVIYELTGLLNWEQTPEVGYLTRTEWQLLEHILSFEVLNNKWSDAVHRRLFIKLWNCLEKEQLMVLIDVLTESEIKIVEAIIPPDELASLRAKDTKILFDTTIQQVKEQID